MQNIKEEIKWTSFCSIMEGLLRQIIPEQVSKLIVGLYKYVSNKMLCLI